MSNWRRRLGAVLVVSLALGGLTAVPTRATHEAFLVDSTADAVDASPGDGTCASAGAVCTLRAAVQEANAHAGTDTINVPTGTYTLAIAGNNENAAATGDLDVTSAINIQGADEASTIIEAGTVAYGGVDRVFEVLSGSTVSIDDVTIRNGQDTTPSPNRGGGGILNFGNLSVADVTFTGNIGCYGGALSNGRAESQVGTGTAIVTRSTFSVNKASCAGSTGSAVHNARGTLTIDDSTIDSNHSDVPIEAAVSNVSSMTISDTTISNNSGSHGGGLDNGCCGNCCDDPAGITLDATNLTIVGNSSDNGGGGVFQRRGVMNLTNSTITGNTNGGVFGAGGVSNLKNNVIANQVSGGDCQGSVTSLGGNLESGTSCGFDSDAANPDAADGDWVSTDPQIGSLTDNGGPTKTQKPAVGSPVVDGGVNSGCAAPDQRGVARPQDGDNNGTATCDVGAVELARYALTVSKAGAGTGTVTSSPAGVDCGSDCTENVLEGTVVTLSADPDDNMTFDGWDGAGCTGTGDCVITMSEPRTVTATFGRIQHALTVTKNGAGTGTVTSSPAGIDCGSTCSANFDQASIVTLSATPVAGSRFDGWSGSGCSGTGTCQVTMSAAQTVTATFSLIPQFQLTVNKTGAGSGAVTSSPAGIDCGPDCSNDYEENTVVTLAATAASGSRFTGWTGVIGCDGTGTCQVTMSAARAVTASFVLTRTLTVTAPGSRGRIQSTPAGILCGTDCSESYDDGTSVTLTATGLRVKKKNGKRVKYRFVGWTGACTGTDPCVLTMDADKNVGANFVKVRKRRR